MWLGTCSSQGPNAIPCSCTFSFAASYAFFLLCKSLLYGKAALDKSEFSPLKCYHTLLLYFFIWLCSLNIMFCWSSHVSPKWHYSASFLGGVIFLCVFVPELLYPSCSWWTFLLLFCPVCRKRSCSQGWGAGLHASPFVPFPTAPLSGDYFFPWEASVLLCWCLLAVSIPHHVVGGACLSGSLSGISRV